MTDFRPALPRANGAEMPQALGRRDHKECGTAADQLFLVVASAVVLSACQLLAASIMLAVALAVAGAPAPHISAVRVAAIVVLGIIGTGFAYVLNYQIIASEGATVASTVTYLPPVVAIVLGVLVLGENVTMTVLAGVALVLAGVALTRHRAKPATDEPQVK